MKAQASRTEYFRRIAYSVALAAGVCAIQWWPRAAAQAPPRTQTPNQTPAQTSARAQVTVGSQGSLPEHAAFTKQQAETGGALFQQNCPFCHGRDAMGGETGPDLTRSKLVASDKDGEAISVVVHNGRLEKGMPKFSLPDADVMNIVAFIHTQQDLAMSQSGNRRGVDESDLRTGDAAAGKQFFAGAGGCAGCHSAEKDLAGIATKYSGLRLEEQMLYPRDVSKPTAVVTTRAGQTVRGTVAYHDEFTIAVTDAAGGYHSWPASTVEYKITDPLQAHADLLPKYRDADIHNLMAYIQTLK